MTRKADKVGVTSHDGILRIDFKYSSSNNRLLNAEMTMNPDGTVTITGEKERWDLNLFGERPNDPDKNLFTEDSYVMRKYWPWSKEKKELRAGWLTYKERDKITYISNSFIIIE
jgi:hypothetical protein